MRPAVLRTGRLHVMTYHTAGDGSGVCCFPIVLCTPD
jgi:hypothetical protein